MAIFAIQGGELDLPRNLALLDTNFLIALVSDDDEHHFDAQLFFDQQTSYVLGVAPPVIVEACGHMSRRQDRVYKLLQLLLDPGSGILILPAPHDVNCLSTQQYVESNLSWMTKNRVDYVDAFLMQMANCVTERCYFKPFLLIVTTDLRDFPRCFGCGYSFGIYDLSSAEELFPGGH